MSPTERKRMRWVMAGVVLTLAASACSQGEMQVAEYVDELNAIIEHAAQRYETAVASGQGGVLVADGARLAGFTPKDLESALEEVRAIEREVEDAVGRLRTPEQVADLHDLVFNFDDDFITTQEAMAARAGTAADWHELSDSPEMAAYRVALAKDRQQCFDAQTDVNAISDRREAFTDTPWVPGELKEIFELVLGCSGYPEHPEDVFRP